MITSRISDILLVEDSVSDIELIKIAIKKIKLDNNLHIVDDGQEALDFLYRKGAYAEAPRPDLILLDLNLPKIDGRIVLENIKNNPELRTIPVIVLTTSDSDQDVFRTYLLHANCYIIKPVNMSRFIEIIRAIDLFWGNIASLPPKSMM